jgi:hypothetical protein
MSEGEFHAYVGLLAVSAVILSVLAARGFGQSAGARILDGVFAAGFLGYAGYLVIADPDTVTIFFYAFAAPVLGVVHAVRSALGRRSRHIPAPPYEGAPAPVAPQPFPAPPAPRAADPATHGSGVDDVPSPYTYRGLSSGLPAQSPEAPITGAAATPPPVSGNRPSGLAGAPAFSLQESGRPYTPRPSGLPEATPPPPLHAPFRLGPDEFTEPGASRRDSMPPRSIAGPRDHAEPGDSAEPAAHTPLRRSQRDFAESRDHGASRDQAEARGGHRDHAEPAVTAAFAAFADGGTFPYRPAHSWHEPRHASPEPSDSGRHRQPDHEPDGPPPADWPPRRA